MNINLKSRSFHDYSCLYLTNTPPLIGYDTKAIFKQSTDSLNKEFSFKIGCLTKATEPNLPYYLLIDGGRINGFMLFSRALEQREIPTASSSI